MNSDDSGKPETKIQSTEASAEPAEHAGEPNGGRATFSVPKKEVQKERKKRTAQQMLTLADAAVKRRRSALKKANCVHRSTVARVKDKLGTALLSALLKTDDADQAKILESLSLKEDTAAGDFDASLIARLKKK